MPLEPKLLETLNSKQRLDYAKLEYILNQLYTQFDSDIYYIKSLKKFTNETSLPKEIFIREIYNLFNNYLNNRKTTYADDLYKIFGNDIEWFRTSGESYFKQFIEREEREEVTKIEGIINHEETPPSQLLIHLLMNDKRILIIKYKELSEEENNLFAHTLFFNHGKRVSVNIKGKLKDNKSTYEGVGLVKFLE